MAVCCCNDRNRSVIFWVSLKTKNNAMLNCSLFVFVCVYFGDLRPQKLFFFLSKGLASATDFNSQLSFSIPKAWEVRFRSHATRLTAGQHWSVRTLLATSFPRVPGLFLYLLMYFLLVSIQLQHSLVCPRELEIFKGKIIYVRSNVSRAFYSHNLTTHVLYMFFNVSDTRI